MNIKNLILYNLNMANFIKPSIKNIKIRKTCKFENTQIMQLIFRSISFDIIHILL